MSKLIVIFTALLISLSTPSLAKSKEPVLYAATSKGCKVAYDTSTFTKMEWSGDCVDGFAEGFGTQTTIESDGTEFTWTGRMVQGKSEGYGTAAWFKKDGSAHGTVKGNWKNNELVNGTATSTRGWIYSGGFKDGIPHGQGTLFFNEGVNKGGSYVGSFQEGEFSGQGVYTYPKGGSFEGNWLFDKKHGAGIERGPDGKVTLTGYWSNGVYSRPFSSVAPDSSSVSPLARSAPAPSSLSACAENGSCYGDISPLTGNPKTIRVDGYYRSDGTYVRGHYRSKGN